MACAQDKSERTPILAWVAGVFGLTLAVALAAVIGVDALHEDPVPALRAQTAAVIQAGDGWVAKVSVKNVSDQTAAEVRIEGTLNDVSGEETAEAVIDYVPARSEREVGLLFTRDPRAGQLVVRPTGYTEP